VDVLAIERRDERAIQTVDDAARLAVADVLEVFDRLRLAHVWRIGGEHLLERARAQLDLLGETHEIIEELFLTGDETESDHVTSAKPPHRSRCR